MIVSHVARGFLVATLAAAACAVAGLSGWIALLAFVVAGNLGVAASAGVAALQARRGDGREARADADDRAAPGVRAADRGLKGARR